MKKFKRRLDTPAKLVKIEGLEQIPLNLDGTVVYGIYVINYVWNYDGTRVVKPRILEFRPPDNRIEFRKNGVKVNKAEKINIISSQSTSPYTATFFSTINTSLPSDMTAYYVERDIDDNITLEVEITNDVVVNITPVQNSVVNNKLPEGKYVFYYEVEYDNGVTTYNKSIGREIVSTTYTTVPQQDPPPYTLVWESLPLPTINKDIGDAFPSIAEMTDIIPTAVLTETATGNTTRFATTYLTPTEPVGGVTTSSAHLIKFMAVNLLSGSGVDTGIDDTTFNTYVVPQLKTRTIQYNIPTQNPAPLPIEITFSPATLDNVVFQDFQSGSSPVPLSFENAGLFPSEAQLLSGVTATYVDDNSVVQPLAVSIVRPTGSLYSEPLKSFFFDNGEVKMHIPRTWPVKYSATAPDGNTKTITRNVVIQDTIAPVISQTIPATMEKGTTYDTWLNRQFYGYDYPRYSDAYPAPRSGTSIIVDKTESEFNALDDGDTFTSTYTSIDSNGNARIVVQVTTCEDTVSPTLAFNSTLTFSTGSNPTDEELKVGVTTSDLSEPIILTVDDSGVNYSTQGFYTASYTATDNYGNSRIQTRNIFVKGAGPTIIPPGSSCPTTPGVPNLYLDGTEIIANLSDSYWLDGLYASLEGENVTYKIIVSQDSIDALPTTAGGTLDYDDNGDGWIDVEVTPLYINYEIQDENGVPLVCTTRYIETIDTLAPTIYNIPNPILVYKAPNDPVTGQSSTTPNDIIADIVSQINVVDNVDGTGFVTATLEGIGQVDINAGNDLTRTLRFTDSEGNESRYVTTIQFTDNMHPAITLLGDNPLTLTSPVLPSDPGATATDFEDGDITADIESYWAQTLGTEARQGTYNVKYTVEDSAGVIVEAIRQVVVPYFAPSITLLGNNPFAFDENPGDQVDPFAEAYSVVDGDLTSQITSNWDEYINDSTSEGTYTITYSITDSTGVTSTVTRTVEFSLCPSTIPNLYFDGTSATAQIGSNSFSLGGATLTLDNGKHDTASFDFEPTGNKNPLVLSSGINLSSGVYTFSLWFYNKRTVNNWGSVIRTSSGHYPIVTKYPDTDELGNYAGSFQGTGYFMTQFEGLEEWTHLAVVASGSTSTYYVNGQQAGTPVNRVITSVANQFGSMTSGQIQTFAEGLDEIAYWDTALEPCEIEAIYNSSEKLGSPYVAPTITLLGNNPYYFSENPGGQTDPGATALSFDGDDLTSQISSSWDSEINGSTTPGAYSIEYSVTASNGLSTTVTRTVEYVTIPDATADHLEESFEDSFGVQTPTSEQQNGQLIGGFYVDSLRNNGWVQGDFSDDLRPVNTADRFTFSAYYRILSTENDSVILFSAWNGNNGWRMVIVKVNDTIARIYVSLNGTNVYLDTGNTVSFTTGQFHHVAMTYNNGTAKLYHNGTEVYSNASKPFVPNTPNDNLYTIGQGTAKIAIDEVSVYKDTELTPDQIGVLAGAVSDKDDEYDQAIIDHIATLPVVNSFNLEESYLDSNDDEQPVILAGTSLSLVDGVFVDQNSGDYAYGDFNDNLKTQDVRENFSFSCYYKFVDSTNGTLHLFRPRDGNNGWSISIIKNSDTNARIFVSYNGTGVYLDTGNTITTSLNQFYHVAMTSYDETMKIYHNGSEVYSNSSKVFLPNTPNNNLYKIGDGTTGTIKGEIDQVKVYRGTLLTPTQISNMATYSTDYTPPTPDPDAIPNITTFGDTSISNDIITFDGDEDWAIYTGGFQYTTQHSVSFWFRTSSSDTMGILSCHVSGGSPASNGYWFRIINGSLRIRALDVDASENVAGSGLNNGQWHHVVLTYQEGTTGGRKMYVDGTETVSANAGVSNPFITEFPLFIGGNPTPGNIPFWPYTGDFYGLQVTNTVLTPTQITAIYNAGVPT